MYKNLLMAGFVYILANKFRGSTYIGVTSDLIKRIWEHRNAKEASHAKKYYLSNLVYYEQFDEIADAIKREKQLKIGIENGNLT